MGRSPAHALLVGLRHGTRDALHDHLADPADLGFEVDPQPVEDSLHLAGDVILQAGVRGRDVPIGSVQTLQRSMARTPQLPELSVQILGRGALERGRQQRGGRNGECRLERLVGRRGAEDHGRLPLTLRNARALFRTIHGLA